MDLTITPPEGYRKTRMRWLWALASCDVCGGSGEYLVNDHEERGEPWDPEDGPLLYPQPCDCLWAPEPEVTRAIDEQNRREREREQQRQRDARAWAEIDAAIAPRRRPLLGQRLAEHEARQDLRLAREIEHRIVIVSVRKAGVLLSTAVLGTDLDPDGDLEEQIVAVIDDHGLIDEAVHEARAALPGLITALAA
ncbi:hypothetical protein [Haloechinothrix halophila]|uniref:hypothetical protein n=1 Tax=Haloechinothrix halophila TaxID=1069073 RepID=UPI000401E2D3|nr:hypothetical protein [Haloechinothrix halophila]